jgi:hypothetical protein
MKKGYKWRINSEKIKICYFPLRFQYYKALLFLQLIHCYVSFAWEIICCVSRFVFLSL